MNKRRDAIMEKPRDTWNTVKRLTGYLKKSSILICLTLVIALIGTVMQVFSPKMLGNATTLIFAGGTGIDFQGLFRVLLIVTGLYAGVCITTFLQERIMLVVSQKLTYGLRNDLKKKLNRVPVSYFDKTSNGNLMSIAINDIDNIVTTLQQSLTQLISSVILFLGILGMMLYISPLLTLTACLMIPASLLIMKLITPQAQKNNKAYFKVQGELSGQIEETYQGFTVVKSVNGEQKALNKFRAANEEMYNAGWKAKFFGGSMMPCMMLAQNIIYVLIAVAGAVKVITGTITIGDMQAFLQYSNQFSAPLAKFSQIWSAVLSAVASAERVFDILDAEEMEEESVACEVIYEEAEKIVFDNISFRYTDVPVITDFSLRVAEGEMIAVVGHTGAGKTTLINLLERFYDVQEGMIRIDGVNIKHIDRQDIRRKIGMVLQETWLFEGTIMENIRFGNPEATQEQVYAAAKASFADEFIQKLPNGYDTILKEEAGNISQGQKQLLTIARAFLSDPEILILDEATSNVDSRTEMVIQKAMKQLLKGRTSFVVAHRLSTIYDADRIIVMEQGNVVETGSHQELIRQGGTYADIYSSQFLQRSA